MPKLTDNKANTILDAAAKAPTQWSIPDPDHPQYNLEGALATLRAAEAKNSPAMLLLFPWAITYASSHLAALCASICSSARVPITLHMDHAQTPEIVKQAADLGLFHSIMVDMSHYEKDENLRLTKELTEYCHERGIATEAEPGRINGGEDGVIDTAELEGILTDADEARRFVDTGIDWLAPAFGNVHGSYGERGVQLDYDRLESIDAAVGGDDGVRLVAHGTDPFDKDIYTKLMKAGITKVNINKVVNRKYMDLQKEGGYGLTELMEKGTELMQKELEGLMDMLGSSGKA
ncbi:MAG: hypothetical protein HETSPECPRED_010361 [Heterodermia speciosa]|uniref:Fructose-bisphosphate aldolase n=1 Tax=Heterodermia speciosa TaxID=116794 RepID=A0A8H3GB98_9LECA|nr:MAG: hypothetical protein HETSPECPRED_010361 [Heterodermia speciosa]